MQNAWSPFRHRAFTMLWGAALLSNIGSWMHDVAAGWLMTTLAPTPLMVALVQSATTLPVFLLALPAGTLADRLDRRRLLIVVQATMLLLAAALGFMVLHGGVTPQLLLSVTFAMGVCTAVLSPTWQAILPKLVPREDFPPAVALHSVGINISRAIGPALGGVIIVAFGIAWPFFFNALSFLAVIAALLWWRPPADAPRQQPLEGFGSSMLIGLQQARSNLALRATLLRSVLFFFFASAYWALLPLVARVQLAGTARLFGVLLGCIGVGAVSSALLLPRARTRFGPNGVLLGGTLGTALAMTVFALIHAPLLAMVASLIAGASWIASLSTLNIAAQLAVPDWVRARGMALFTAVLYGCLALGSIVWGHVAGIAGIEAALLLAAGGAVAALAIAPRLLPQPGK
ncbi:MAG: MFS transporter [Pseudomonadota bacterium]